MSTIQFTNNQKKAIETIESDVVISAGAGSGKTTVLVERFLNILMSGKEIKNLLAVTFTEKAADHMKESIYLKLKAKIDQIAQDDSKNPLLPHLNQCLSSLNLAQISTIHGFCSNLLKENAIEAGIDPHFRLLDEIEMKLMQEKILDDLIQKHFFSEEEAPSQFSKDLWATFFLRFPLEKTKDNLVSDLEKLRSQDKRVDDINIKLEIPFKKYEEKLAEVVNAFSNNMSSKPTDSVQKKLVAIEELLKIISNQLSDLQVYKEILPRLSLTVKDEVLKSSLKEAQLIAKNILLIIREKELAQDKEMYLLLLKSFEENYYFEKRNQGLLDFEDLLLKTAHLLKSKGAFKQEVKKRIENKFHFVMIDEMQDTNPLQFEIFSQIKGKNNVFYVGDLKQSIYRFRFANLKLFSSVIGEAKEGSEGKTFISLAENFRSTPGVLEFVNKNFEVLWKDVPHLFEPLKQGRLSLEQKVPQMILLSDPNQKISQLRRKEGAWVADKMKELHEEGTPYSEMTLLLRSLGSVAYFETEMRNRGIPYQVVQGKGFFSRLEVRDLIHYLKILEGPHLELEIYSVLRSPLFGLTDQSLLEIHEQQKKTNQMLMPFILNSDDISLSTPIDQTTLETFKTIYRRFSSKRSHLRLGEILSELIELTHIDSVQLGKHLGMQRFNNLKKLQNAVVEFEKNYGSHLGELNHYLENLRKQEMREEDISFEKHEMNHVQIMSIHRSKGLEFPVVFVGDLGRKESSKYDFDFIVSSNLDLGIKDPTEPNPSKKKLFTFKEESEHEQIETLAEYKRLFYVAATRAKDQLYFTASFNGFSKNLEGSFLDHLNVISWFAALYPNLRGFLEDETQESLDENEIQFLKPNLDEIHHKREIPKKEYQKIYEGVLKGKPKKEFPLPPQVKLASQVMNATSFSLLTYCERAFVLKEISKVPDPPKMMDFGHSTLNGEPLSSSEKLGTEVHRLISQIQPQDPESYSAELINDRVKYFKEKGQKELLLKCINNFVGSEYFELLKKEEVVCREKKFLVSVGRHYLQGIIDFAYLENDQWVVVDFKTTVIHSSKHQKWLKAFYLGQLQAYSYALEKVTGKKVKEAKLLYLNDMSEEIISSNELYIDQLTEATIEKGYGEKPNWSKQHCEQCYLKIYCPTNTN